MLKRKAITSLLVGSLTFAPVAGLVSMTGCEQLPGSSKTQGAVIGGAGGALAGAAISKHSRLLGALIGGALGAGGGYLIGAQVQKTRDPDRHRDEAVRASRYAESHPARSSDVDPNSRSQTADLNNDGFVTLDEVVAMRDAGLSERDMIQRLRDTGQVFELTSEQEDYLRKNGVSRNVVTAMRDLNQDDTSVRHAGYDNRDSRDRYDSTDRSVSRGRYDSRDSGDPRDSRYDSTTGSTRDRNYDPSYNPSQRDRGDRY
jgi:hypothetical protein